MSMMRMIKHLQIFWLFYNSFAVASLFFTLCCISLYWKYEFSVFSGTYLMEKNGWSKSISL